MLKLNASADKGSCKDAGSNLEVKTILTKLAIERISKGS
jgi:hypothetical protein